MQKHGYDVTMTGRAGNRGMDICCVVSSDQPFEYLTDTWNWRKAYADKVDGMVVYTTHNLYDDVHRPEFRVVGGQVHCALPHIYCRPVGEVLSEQVVEIDDPIIMDTSLPVMPEAEELYLLKKWKENRAVYLGQVHKNNLLGYGGSVYLKKEGSDRKIGLSVMGDGGALYGLSGENIEEGKYEVTYFSSDSTVSATVLADLKVAKEMPLLTYNKKLPKIYLSGTEDGKQVAMENNFIGVCSQYNGVISIRVVDEFGNKQDTMLVHHVGYTVLPLPIKNDRKSTVTIQCVGTEIVSAEYTPLYELEKVETVQLAQLGGGIAKLCHQINPADYLYCEKTSNHTEKDTILRVGLSQGVFIESDKGFIANNCVYTDELPVKVAFAVEGEVHVVNYTNDSPTSAPIEQEQ